MSNTFKVHGFMPVALVALALGACSNGKKTDDSTADTDTTASTADTGDTDSGFFTPTSFQMTFLLAYNANHELTTFKAQGNEFPPLMLLEFTNAASTTCDFEYHLNLAKYKAFLASGLPPVHSDTDVADSDVADTDGLDATSVAFADFLDTQGLVGGLLLQDGLYDLLAPTDCTLDPATWGTDPLTPLGPPWQVGWQDHLTDAAQTDIAAAGGFSQVFSGGITEDQMVGGTFRFQPGFLTGGDTDVWIYGYGEETDESGNLVIGADSNPVLRDASDTVEGGQPTAGVVVLETRPVGL